MWSDRLKKEKSEPTRKTLHVDMEDDASQVLMAWIEKQARLFNTKKSQVVKAILADAMEAEAKYSLSGGRSKG